MARGSQPGERRGGRRKGTPNRASVAREKEIAASGLTPLQYLTSVYRDEKAPRDMRIDAAAKAAPFVHPKLASIIHKGDAKQPVAIATISAKQYEAMARKLLSEV